MTDLSLVRELELIGCRAWRAAEIEEHEGWFLRANEGVTRRANSVLPVTFTGNRLDTAIEHAIHFYRDRGLPTFFQLTVASQPPHLDETLETRGFERELEVHVQVASTSTVASCTNEIVVEIQKTADDVWRRCFATAEGFDEETVRIRQGIMQRASGLSAYALARVDGEPAGVGFAVVTDEWLGLFGIATVKRHRRKGVGTAITTALAAWGENMGAERAYLQVEVLNAPALKLYGQLGFRTAYTYWYRLLRC
ncbi:MAG: GNAT family N-acetyltransferase [Candidatus Thorarchaeota archaeon]